jgi:hypothetical protein
MQPRIVKSELNLAQTIHLALRFSVTPGEYIKALEEAKAFLESCQAQADSGDGDLRHQFVMQTNEEVSDLIGRSTTHQDHRRVARLLEELAEKIFATTSASGRIRSRT